ncbi:hypothetical protein HK405_015860, partial [Cladochytrium tenue]
MATPASLPETTDDGAPHDPHAPSDAAAAAAKVDGVFVGGLPTALWRRVAARAGSLEAVARLSATCRALRADTARLWADPPLTAFVLAAALGGSPSVAALTVCKSLRACPAADLVLPLLLQGLPADPDGAGTPPLPPADPRYFGDACLRAVARDPSCPLHVARALLDHGADPSAEQSEPALAALRTRRLDLLRLFLLGAADSHRIADARDRDCELLVATAAVADLDVVRLLLIDLPADRRPDPNAREGAALTAACGAPGNIELATLLLDAGADPAVNDNAAIKALCAPLLRLDALAAGRAEAPTAAAGVAGNRGPALWGVRAGAGGGG